MGPIGPTEKYITSYKPTLRNIPEEQRPQIRHALLKCRQLGDISVSLAVKCYEICPRVIW